MTWKKGLIIILVLIICAFPSICYSEKQIIDPYDCINSACVEKSLMNGIISSIGFGGFYFDPNSQGHTGYQSIIMIISLISGYSVKQVSLLPIGGLLVPFSFFALSKKMFQSNIVSIFLAVFMSFDPSLSLGHYSVFAYSWDRVLLFLFILVNLRIVTNKKTAPDVIILLIIFIGMFSIYWTTPFLMIFYMLAVNLLSFIQKKIAQKNEFRYKNTVISTLIFFIIYSIFSKVLYNEYLPAIISEKYGSPTDAVTQLISWIFLNKSTVSEEYSMVSSGTQLYDLLLMSRYIIILVPVIFYLIIIFFQTLKEHKLKINFDLYSYYIWPVLFTSAIQTIAYAARGHLSFRYTSLLFLPITIISLDRLKAEKVKFTLLCILLLLVLSGFSFLYMENFPGYNKVTNVEYSSHFMFERLSDQKENPSILLDFNTFGIYLMESVYFNPLISVKQYNSDFYKMLVEPESIQINSTPSVDYVIINNVLLDNPTRSVQWKSYEPLSKYVTKINSNKKINKIYSDDYIWIFKT